MKKFLIKTINFYQKYISGLTGQNCRYYPSCSNYSKIAITKYGVFSGIIKSIKRILRCNPFSRGGIDYP